MTLGSFELIFTQQADEDLAKLEKNKGSEKILKAVYKAESEGRENVLSEGSVEETERSDFKMALGYLETNPRHPGLNTHEFTSLSKQFGIKIYEAYAQNNTPGAYRIFWHYGPNKENITIIAITPHL